MNKKTITQIIIVVIAFSGSGIVLYNGFFKNSSRQAMDTGLAGQSLAVDSQKILPYGSEDLSKEFEVLKRQNLFYNVVVFPILDTKNDFGVPESSLISPPATP